ncbi:MAG: T9SS type A sorting domain-containing protein, partial [Bacteroidetes bacterium]|nr:T9SS type A sorting domain-containing protein [Bacteroidota bacterium]
PPYEYAWSNGRTTPNNDSLEAGPFSITVTDANGCIFPSEEQTLSAIDIFEASINLIKPISCPEGANGELKASVQGATTPITYTWNTGDTTPTLGQVSSGWYQVTVSDSTDCQTVSDSFFVTAPQPIELSSLETRPQRCIGVFDAEVNIEVRGGSSPYAYAWLTPDGETLSQRNLKDIGPGNYQLTITDFNGCSQAFEPIEVDSASGFTFLEALTSASSCPISPDGHIDIALSEGLAPLSIQWSDGAIGALSRGDLRPGFYELTITNPLECKRRLGPFEIPAGQEGLEVELTAMDTLVCDSGKGIHIESEVSEGQTPVEYHWNSGRKIIRDQLTDSLLVLTPGRYTVTVTDSYGCVGESEQIEILGKAPIELDQVDVRIPDCPDYKNGYIEVSASTTAPPLRYSWSNGDQLAHIRDLSAGIYELTIEDDTRCLPFTASYELSGPSPFEVQIDTFYQNDQVCFEYQISGGLPPYNRFWNDIFNQDNPICFDPGQSQILFQIEDIQSCGPNLVVWESSTSSDVPLSASFDVEIYPNPVKAILHIESSSHSPTSLEVFHISGHKWDEVTLNSPYFTYQMERFPPGVYIFRFANDNGQVEFREVVKQ